MTFYNVPRNLTEEEKIFGGIASLRQAAYVASAAGLGLAELIIPMLVSTPLFFIPLWLRVIIALCIISVGAILAFVRIDSENVDAWLYHAARYYLRPNVYTWNAGGRE